MSRRIRMTRAMLEELARIAQNDAEAIRAHHYRRDLTAEERHEADRLDALSRRIAYRAVCTPGRSRYPLE